MFGCGSLFEDGLSRSELRWRQIAVLLLLLALWITTRPYQGVIHDARLYTAQALNAIYPDRFADDLFFKYGSQDNFTLFTKLYAPLIAMFGVSHANMIATAVGQGLWLAALFWLVTCLFDDGKTRLVAALGAILLFSGYGGYGVFSYGERFSAPRIFVEAGVMSALALTLAGRWIFASFIIVLAGTIHPIMAATGGAVLTLLAAFKDRRIWLVIAAGTILILAAAFAGIDPFRRLLARFDDGWFAVVKQRCGFGILSRWVLEDWLHVVANVAVTGVAWTLGTKKERNLIGAVTASAVCSLVLTFLGGDLGRNILIVNLQPWRMLWLLSLFANLFMGASALRIPDGWTSRELFIALLLVSFVAQIVGAVQSVLAVLTLLTCIVFVWEWRHGQPLQRRASLILIACPMLGIGLEAMVAWLRSAEEMFAVRMISGVFGLLALALLVFLTVRPRPWLFVLAPLIGISAIACIDHRDGWEKVIESHVLPSGLDQFLSGSRKVYWENGVELLWLTLKTPSYYSCLQGAGAMFYRGTAMEFRDKSAVLRNLNTRDFGVVSGPVCAVENLTGEGPKTKAQVIAACHALQDLDALVLNHPLADAPARQWTSPKPAEFFMENGEVERISTYYKYSCSDFRPNVSSIE